MNRALACLALVGLAALPRSLYSQDMPEALKASALSVRVRAVVPAAVADQAAPQPKSPSTPQATSQADPNAPAAKGQGGDASSDKQVPWQSESVKSTVPGNPVLYKFVREDIAILVQLTPFNKPDGKGITLVVQCQAWVKPLTGRLVYHASMDTLELAYDENVFFFPLGRDAATGKAPIRFDIAVSRSTAPAPAATPSGTSSEKPSDKAGK